MVLLSDGRLHKRQIQLQHISAWSLNFRGNNDDRLSVGLYNVVTDNDSDVIKNMDVGRKLPDNDMAENSTGYIYSGKELSYDAMTANVNFLNNASYDSVYKNDPQSIYQAQASVISPLVLKLLDL